ncbi:hypothetical protein [Sporolactobacillus sp. KGMB 08714]|uniref:hypothetical protein n=1 Tax=Sporolactobacillus sp. KGMB 08714 TaxID=3064704 RepID=UPI002FBD3492
MNPNTKYVGLDVSKEKIAVAVAEEGRSQPRYIGMILYREKSLGKLMEQLGDGDPEQLRVCYEAGVDRLGPLSLAERPGHRL